MSREKKNISSKEIISEPTNKRESDVKINEKPKEISKKVVSTESAKVKSKKVNEIPIVDVEISKNVKTLSKEKDNKNTVKEEKDIKKIGSKRKNKSSRPQTAYNIFMKDKMTEIEAPNQTEKLKIIAKFWKDLKDKDKVKYHQEADLKKKEFFDQKEKMQSENGKKKRLPNAYNIFLKERMQLINGINQKDKLIKIAFEWKNLDLENKNVFIEKALKLREEKQEEKTLG